MTVMAELPDVRERGLLRTVCEYPDDDTPRLVYADWLQEQGRDERAEFIRVQCELDPVRSHGHGTKKPHRGGCVTCSLVAHLERREWKLIHAHVGWADDAWPVPNHHWHPIEVGFLSADAGAELQFRRGFVEEVTCTTQDWKDHGPTIVVCQPVTRVTLSDKRPQDYHNNDQMFHNGRLYGWYQGPGPDTINDHSLSPGLWDLISTRPGCVRHGPWADFCTKAEALAAASAACVRWARDKAGLPGLPEG